MHTTDSPRSTTMLTTGRKSSLAKIGGSLGIAGTCISLLLFLFALFGFYAAFMLSILPLAFGGIGAVVTVLGGIFQKHEGDAETQPISALFACAMAIIAGVIELQIWMTWPRPA